MANKTIIIDGYIGALGFSKQYVRNELQGNEKKPLTVKISSMGGSVDHALSIFDQFREHGNVTAELSAFVASSATLISLGAKTVQMNENSFYLIHKPMYWVDSWGTMNEDDIDNLVAQLEKQKQQLAKITIQMARMYVAKTGKPLEEIISLMKQETWLTAEEAKEWGFVDEIIQPEEATNLMENERLVALITANGFPTPPGIKGKPSLKDFSTSVNSSVDEDSLFERLWNRISGKQKEHTKINNKDDLQTNKQITTTMKQFEKINAALGVAALESVDGYVSLDSSQLEALENVFVAKQQMETERDTAVSQRDTAISERDQARQDLTSAITPFDDIDASVAAKETPEEKAAAIRALLAAQPGTRAEVNLDTSDPKAGKASDTDWDAIDRLPHNKTVDQNS